MFIKNFFFFFFLRVATVCTSTYYISVLINPTKQNFLDPALLLKDPRKLRHNYY